MPPLIPLNAAPSSGLYEALNKMMSQRDDDTVKLVISETQELESKPTVTVPASSTVVAEEEEEAADEEEEQEEDEAEEDEAAYEVEEGDEEEAAAAEEEEQEQELELVPVRIKKVTYWKDEPTGDIYQYLADDECGDKVGTYVDGKPVFD